MSRCDTNNAEVTDKAAHNILVMLLTHGFDRTLEYFCTLSAFSVLSVA
jgi:hypothetical protein